MTFELNRRGIEARAKCYRAIGRLEALFAGCLCAGEPLALDNNHPSYWTSTVALLLRSAHGRPDNRWLRASDDTETVPR
jgi:hypothetical protein